MLGYVTPGIIPGPRYEERGMRFFRVWETVQFYSYLHYFTALLACQATISKVYQRIMRFIL